MRLTKILLVVLTTAVTSVMSLAGASNGTRTHTQGPVYRFFQGINTSKDLPDGSCKKAQDYEKEINKMRAWSNTSRFKKFEVLKIFSTSECDALSELIPVVLRLGFTVWPVVWVHDRNKWAADRAALEHHLQLYGTKWLEGVTVGSEALYRWEIPPAELAAHVEEIKTLVQKTYNATHIPIGVADTWSSWVTPDNLPVVNAVDVVMMNAFPFWEHSSIENALEVFKGAIHRTRDFVGWTKPFYIGETGWPTEGPPFGDARPGIANAHRYFKTTTCYLRELEMSYFWYNLADTPLRAPGVEQSFGLSDKNYDLKYELDVC